MEDAINKIKQPHRPSRLQTILFFFLTLLIAAGILAWTFFINKGALVIEGPRPFQVSSGSEKIVCTDDLTPCALSLTPATHTVTLSKKGYFDDEREVKIVRGKDTKVTADFQYIPVLREMKGATIPSEDVALRMPFLGAIRPQNFPQNPKQSLWSSIKNRALLALGKEIYLYDADDNSLELTFLKPEFKPAWLGDEVVWLATEGEKQILKRWRDKISETIVVFDRPFENPRLLGAASKKFVIIVDNGAYYLVDAEVKSRKRLDIAPDTGSGSGGGGGGNSGGGGLKIFANSLIFKKADGKIAALNLETLVEQKLIALDTENIIEAEPGVFIFPANSKQDSPEAKLGPSISEALEAAKETKEFILSEKQKTNKLFITEFDTAGQKARTLAEVPIEETEKLQRLTLSIDNKAIYFVLQNEDKKPKLFEVLLEPF